MGYTCAGLSYYLAFSMTVFLKQNLDSNTPCGGKVNCPAAAVSFWTLAMGERERRDGCKE